LGPGITQRARAIVDWNDPAILRNGWYYSDPLSLNTPDYDTGWMGECVLTYDGRGMQRVSSMTDNRTFIRRFSFPGVSPLAVFTAWQHVSGDPEVVNMPTENPAVWSTGASSMVRSGNTVTLCINTTAASNVGGGGRVFALPLRYQPSALHGSHYFWAVDSASGGQNLMYVDYTGVYHTFGRSAGQGTVGSVTYVTPNPW
jgi:hypothetical protein